MFGSLTKKDLFKLIGVFYLSLSEVCAVNPKPTSATWVNAATTTIAGMIGKVVGGEQANSDTEDWSSFQDFMENARQAVSEVLDGIIPNEEILESLRNNLPDLTSLGLDLQNAAESFKDWDWDKFAEEMLPSTSYDEADDESEFSSNALKIPPECSMTSPEIIKFSGYPCEVHHAETNDGYILELHRIPFGRSGSKQRWFSGRKRPVVFFQHGLLADSACWISNGADKSLPFLLADAGCDVWLGNVRGNSYSRKHKNLNPDTDERYWRFSWQHMSQSDLPAMVNKALRESGQSSLYYVGHSQGTLIAFARLAEDPLFNDKIRLFFALGPVTTVANITSPVRSMASLAKPAQFGMQLFGGAEILPKKVIYQWISAKMHALHKSSEANDSLLYQGSNMMMYMCGVHPDRYHQDRLPIYSSHTPSGTSIQNLVHFGQMVMSGKMKKWDFMSEAENMDAYGQPTSPEYDLTRIRTQVALYIGSDDQLADPVDSKALSKKLKNLVHYEVLQGWDHLDFLWGQEAVDSVYADILHLLASDHATSTSASRSDEL